MKINPRIIIELERVRYFLSRNLSVVACVFGTFNVMSLDGDVPINGLLLQILAAYLVLMNEVYFFESIPTGSLMFPGFLSLVNICFIVNIYQEYPHAIRFAALFVILAEAYFVYVWLELKRRNR